MGRKGALSQAEKSKIVQSIHNKISTLEIAKELDRDHRTIKKFVTNPELCNGRSDKGKIHKKALVSRRAMSRIEREVHCNPLETSKKVFENAGVPDVPKSTRCRILRTVAKCGKPEVRPPLKDEAGVSRAGADGVIGLGDCEPQVYVDVAEDPEDSIRGKHAMSDTEEHSASDRKKLIKIEDDTDVKIDISQEHIHVETNEEGILHNRNEPMDTNFYIKQEPDDSGRVKQAPDDTGRVYIKQEPGDNGRV
ncbi:uncharacterized protein LOC143034407 isoform X2 [Oratosquilla oratoria]|uniref:uncharacterized protein LOC143034407 isoform X2 n=1 Tax=Oratosquilla oratoria TaxID=337810 RepID=UPI003F76F9BA